MVPEVVGLEMMRLKAMMSKAMGIGTKKDPHVSG